jgi:hypothetical protein
MVCSLPVVGRPFAVAEFMTLPGAMSESIALGVAEVMGVDGGDGEVPSSLEHDSARDRKPNDSERKKN